MISSPSFRFIRRNFAEYYADGSSICLPSFVRRREFGFALFEGGMLRHKRFEDGVELEGFLQAHVPSDAYFSCAYYEDPEAEMERKGWLGADLVFDIDADHIPTPCGKVHDWWTCGDCHFVGKGLTPEKCPACGGEKFDVKTWPCEACLEAAKAETIKLLDMLMRDFGFSDKDVHVFFSGHRGYHVHVESKIVEELDAAARKEIVDYVCGLGLDTGFDRFAEGGSNKKFPISPRLDDLGWRGRLSRSMYDFVMKGEVEGYREAGLSEEVFGTIRKNRAVILRHWDDVGPYKATKDVGFETWRKIVESCVDSLSAKIDTVVTTDVHRLIRLTGALHGKTGLKKVGFPISEIETFDPFKSGVAFKGGAVTVFVSDVPQFRLGDEMFGPYRNQKVDLPNAASLLLVCKGRGEVVE